MSFRIPVAILLGLGAILVAPSSADSSVTTSPRWRNVTYDGVRFSVPASWPVIRFARHPLACPRLDVHAVYLGTPGPNPICPAGLVGKTEAVMVGPGPGKQGNQDDKRRRPASDHPAILSCEQDLDRRPSGVWGQGRHLLRHRPVTRADNSIDGQAGRPGQPGHGPDVGPDVGALGTARPDRAHRAP